MQLLKNYFADYYGMMFEQQNPLALANLVLNHRQLSILCDVPLPTRRVRGSQIFSWNAMWVVIYSSLCLSHSEHCGLYVVRFAWCCSNHSI
jgi:hypothetical protein